MNNLPSPDAPNPNKPLGYEQEHRLELLDNDSNGIDALLNSKQGYIVGRLGNELLRFNTDAHLLTISPTGGGKGTGLIIPNLLDHPGSAFVIDIRGETVAKTATARRLQGQHIVVLDPYDITKGQWGIDSYNPLDRVAQDSFGLHSDDQIDRLAEALMFDSKGRTSNEPIWDNATRGLLCGLLTYCLRYCEPDKKNLKEILSILNYTEKEMFQFTNRLEKIIENNERAKRDEQLKGLLKILTDAKSTTKITDNAIVQARTVLKWVGHRAFDGMIETSTFSFDHMQTRNMTVYLVVPEEFIKSCAVWVRLMLENAVFSLKDIHNSKGKSTKSLFQSERVLFLLDELPAFGQLDIISSGMATLRGRGVNLWLFIQNLAQLESTYGKEPARTIIGNVASLQVFESNELEELEYFTRVIGEDFFDVQSVTISESTTEGTSKTKGTSHTVSNSVSFSKTEGTSDTIGESVTTSWNRSFGHSTNSGVTTNSGSSWNSSSGASTPRNWLASTSGTNNSNSGSAWNWGKSRTSGSGTNSSYSVGKQQSKSHSKTTTHSETVTNSKSESDTQSESFTESSSFTLGRSVQVKKERMKLETVRSLRAKLSGKNQLLLIRGYQPFFCPRMSHFVKYQDTDRYMFPDMAAMISIDAFVEMANRPALVNSYVLKPEILDENKIFAELEGFLGRVEREAASIDGHLSTLSLYQTFLKEIVPNTFDVFVKLEDELLHQRQAFEEIAVANLALLKMIQNAEIQGFEECDQVLIENMIEIESLSQKQSILNLEKVRKFAALPLAQGRSLRSILGSSNSMNEIYSRLSSSELMYGYVPSFDDLEWLVEVYYGATKNAFDSVRKEIEQVKKMQSFQEGIRGWLLNNTSDICNNLNTAIEKAVMRDIKIKAEFSQLQLRKNY